MVLNPGRFCLFRNILLVMERSLLVTSEGFFKLEDSCFTMLCWFLPYINTNQPQVYTCPLPPTPPLHAPLWGVCTGSSHWLPIFIQWCLFPCCSLNPSRPLLSPLCPHVCLLRLRLYCYSTLQTGRGQWFCSKVCAYSSLPRSSHPAMVKSPQTENRLMDTGVGGVGGGEGGGMWRE